MKLPKRIATIGAVATLAAVAAPAASACAVTGTGTVPTTGASVGGADDTPLAYGGNTGGWGYAPAAARQLGVINTNGAPLVDLRCVAPWTISALATRYSACNQSPVDQADLGSSHFVG